MTSPPRVESLHPLFERWARRVRRRLALRRVLTGLAWGLAAGGGAAVAAWYLRHGALRPWAALFGVAGALFGLAVALRRRWSDAEVALYLDARLGADEVISTALALEAAPGPSANAEAAIAARAARALGEGDPSRARPRVLARAHGVAPLAGALVAAMSLLPLPPSPPAPPPPPGAERVKLERLAGLDAIIALERLATKTDAERERLKQIAEDAKRLRAGLREGMEQREAQAEIARLRDEIAAERLDLGDQKNRAGLEAAVGALAKNDALKDAAKALGDGDLVDFDQEMQKLANLAEREAREQAKQALEEAEKAARERGAGDVASSLAEQREAFAQREARAEALRELARGLEGHLSEQARRDLEEFGETGSPEAQKRLAESLEQALEGLSPEERKRLAERLQKQMEGEGGAAPSPLTREQIEALARKLADPKGQQELADQMKELARQAPSAGAERQQGLDEAERGGAEAQQGLGATPMPMPGETGGGAPGEKPAPSGNPGGDPSKHPPGGPGSHHDTGRGDHSGSTGEVAGGQLRAKASARVNPGAPLHGATLGRAPGRAGETANQAGTGALGTVGPTELDGVERNQVPEEYREQVGRYFQP
ncbi:MAG: hypothetical protein OZ921_13885 [Sorangiineae bacterium]|nr:hypothetical protein [Polyangiaceae bacterium]MEB2323598.1 hypothetical protein [Sorangiineae bacterium]